MSVCRSSSLVKSDCLTFEWNLAYSGPVSRCTSTWTTVRHHTRFYHNVSGGCIVTPHHCLFSCNNITTQLDMYAEHQVICHLRLSCRYISCADGLYVKRLSICMHLAWELCKTCRIFSMLLHPSGVHKDGHSRLYRPFTIVFTEHYPHRENYGCVSL